MQKWKHLKLPYQMTKQTKGAAGNDEMSFKKVETAGVNKILLQIQNELRSETCRPQRNRVVEIPKAKGKTRKLGIPMIRDRVLQNALRIILEPVFEADFQDTSYGYRPKRTAHQAVERVRTAIAIRNTRVIDVDLKSYFDTVKHPVLLNKVAERINDNQVMHLLKIILKTGGKMDVPQGGPLSPLLSNIYLNEVDKMLKKAKSTSTEGDRAR